MQIFCFLVLYFFSLWLKCTSMSFSMFSYSLWLKTYQSTALVMYVFPSFCATFSDFVVFGVYLPVLIFSQGTPILRFFVELIFLSCTLSETLYHWVIQKTFEVYVHLRSVLLLKWAWQEAFIYINMFVFCYFSLKFSSSCEPVFIIYKLFSINIPSS